MKNVIKQTIITGEDFTLQSNVNEIDIFEEKYVASIVNQKNGQILAVNVNWRVNLGVFQQLKQINIFNQSQKIILVRDEEGVFPEFQTNLIGAYTETYLAASTLAA